MKSLWNFWNSISIWPVTTVYVSSVIALILVVNNALDPVRAGLLLGLIALMSIQISTRKELKMVHALVNSQHVELIDQRMELFARVDQLIGTLNVAGIAIPADLTDSMRKSGQS